MNKTTRIFAAALMAGASSVSIASSEFYAINGEHKLGDDFERGHELSKEFYIPGISAAENGSPVVVQFNVRSTNKSPYNAVYLVPSIDRIDLVGGWACDPVQGNDAASAPDLVTFLPYAPHKEVHNNQEWSGGWRSVHAVVQISETMQGRPMSLMVCSRDKNGDVTGDMDDFYIKDIVVQYQADEYSFYGRQ